MSEFTGQFGSGGDDLEPEREAIGPEPDVAGSRWFRRHFAGSVSIVTTVSHDTFRAATVTSASVVSLQPLLLLVSLEEDSQMVGWLEESGFFALNLLPWREQYLADQFAGFTPRAHPMFEGISHTTGETGAPLLSGSVGWADCRVTQQLHTGDHKTFIGKALQLGVGWGDRDDPLLYFMSRYRRLKP